MVQTVTYIKKEIPILLKKIEPICKEYNIVPEHLIQETVKFLNLVHLSKQKISPSHIVDLAWHEFILFTRFYAKFCEENFNRFIHHTPSASSTKSLFDTTLKEYKLHYGTPPQNIWGSENTIEWNTTDCGSCHN